MPEGKERHEFVIDDDDIDGNDNWAVDKVRLGLNLAFVHETVVKDFIFSKADLERNVLDLKGT